MRVRDALSRRDGRRKARVTGARGERLRRGTAAGTFDIVSHVKIVSDLCTVVSDLCTVVSDLCTVVSDLCTVVSDLCTVVSDLCTVVSDPVVTPSGLTGSRGLELVGPARSRAPAGRALPRVILVMCCIDILHEATRLSEKIAEWQCA